MKNDQSFLKDILLQIPPANKKLKSLAALLAERLRTLIGAKKELV